MHNIDYWTNIIKQTDGIDIISIKETESNIEIWNDWINCDKEYAKSDKKAIEAGACIHLNFISVVLRRK